MDKELKALIKEVERGPKTDDIDQKMMVNMPRHNTTAREYRERATNALYEYPNLSDAERTKALLLISLLYNHILDEERKGNPAGE